MIQPQAHGQRHKCREPKQIANGEAQSHCYLAFVENGVSGSANVARRPKPSNTAIAATAIMERVMKFDWSQAKSAALDEKAQLSEKNNEIYWLKAETLEKHEVRLVVIDPLSAYMGQIDGNQNSQVRTQLKGLAKMAAEARVAIVAIAHLNKQVSAAAVNRVMGAISFMSTARSVWSVVRDPESAEQRLMLPMKSNISAASAGMRFRFAKVEGFDAPKLEWGDAPVTTTFEGSRERRLDPAEREMQDKESYVMERLREELVDGPKERSLLKMVLTGTEQQQYRAAQKMGILKLKEGYKGGWVWMLPEHLADWEAGKGERLERQGKAEAMEVRRMKRKRRRRKERLWMEGRP
jgi:hypothetical protein